MPTYEYQCQNCHHRFEVFQSMSEKPLAICPKCAGKVRRLFSPGAGLIFKGSGFYATDYKKKESGTGGGESKSKAGKKPGSEEKSSESN